ncbi:hypothetical protein SAMN05421507_10485 [Lentzea jiangxiensis]|uniref:Uncharacterized protein n=1 Tax=Lentzea jiangxiensis TaxID=641025 RepID=A0A1H0MQP4_9PSEU|nr:hypothetical protein SAMN05421507_10485 [Lentzea jiangxiensis]
MGCTKIDVAVDGVRLHHHTRHTASVHFISHCRFRRLLVRMIGTVVAVLNRHRLDPVGVLQNCDLGMNIVMRPGEVVPILQDSRFGGHPPGAGKDHRPRQQGCVPLLARLAGDCQRAVSTTSADDRVVTVAVRRTCRDGAAHDRFRGRVTGSPVTVTHVSADRCTHRHLPPPDAGRPRVRFYNGLAACGRIHLVARQNSSGCVPQRGRSLSFSLSGPLTGDAAPNSVSPRSARNGCKARRPRGRDQVHRC